MAVAAKNSLQARRVFVTGATGFIGQPLVRALVAAGAQVTTLSRRQPARGAAVDGQITHVVGTMGDAALLDAALRDQDILINLAYDVRVSGAENLAGFETLVTAATKAGVARIVHTSSIVVYDGWPDQDLSENAPAKQPGGGPYRETKIEMERRLLGGAIPVAILQPTIVYGPKSALWTDQLAEAMASGGVILPDPEGLCNGVFVDDLVQAILCAATVEDLQQEQFIISGPAPFSWSDLLNGYAEIIGSPPVQRVALDGLRQQLGKATEASQADTPSAAARVSTIARKLIGHDRFEALVRALKRRIAKPGPMVPDHHLLGVFSATGACDISHARRRLGYDPKFDLAKGLAGTKAHLHDLIKPK